MRILWVIVLLVGTFPVTTQEAQCVEVFDYWTDEVRHEVNLDTGTVITYDAPDPYATDGQIVSPDGRFGFTLNYGQGPLENTLSLTDNRRGVSITLAKNVGSTVWSPDGAWLAYVELDADGHALTLHNIDRGARVSVRLPEIPEWDTPYLKWSLDGRLIAVTMVIDPSDGRSAVLLYSVPNLSLLHTFATTLTWAEVEWSPSGSYLTAQGRNGEVALIDVESEHVTMLALSEPSFYFFHWPSGERFLLISRVYSDFNDEINVVNAQGEIVLEDVITTSYQWANDHQLLVNVWDITGLSYLTLFDLETGEQRVIQRRSGFYALSPDGRYVAANADQLILFFDLSLEQNAPVRTIHLDGEFNPFIWNDHELVVLFEDQSLRGYNFETSAWRSIATIPPGDNDWLQRVPCAA